MIATPRKGSTARLRRGIGYVIQARRAVPAPHRPRQRRHRAVAARGRAQEGPGRRDGAARTGRPAGRVRQPLSGSALGRPAAAGRGRPRAGRRSAGDADGRAVQRRRPGRARPAAGRVPAAAGRAAQDDRLRHARHRRSHQDGRSGRRAAGRRPVGPAGDAGRAARPSGRSVRRRLRRPRPGLPRPRLRRGRHVAAAAREPDRASAPISSRAAGFAEDGWVLVVDNDRRPQGWLAIGAHRDALAGPGDAELLNLGGTLATESGTPARGARRGAVVAERARRRRRRPMVASPARSPPPRCWRASSSRRGSRSAADAHARPPDRETAPGYGAPTPLASQRGLAGRRWRSGTTSASTSTRCCSGCGRTPGCRCCRS